MQARTGGPRSVNTEDEVLEALAFAHGGFLEWGVTILDTNDAELGSGRISYSNLGLEDFVILRRFKWNSVKRAYRMELDSAVGSIYSTVTVLPSANAVNVEVSTDGTTWYAVPPSGEVPLFAGLGGVLTGVVLWVRFDGGQPLPGAPFLHLLGPSTPGYLSITRPAWGALIQLDVRVVCAADAWNPAVGPQYMIACYGDAPNISWGFAVSASPFNRVQLSYSTDGTNGFTSSDTSNSPASVVVDGEPILLRVTWDKATGDVKFYYKDYFRDTYKLDCQSNGGWTQLGSTCIGPTSALANNTTDVSIGAKLTSSTQREFDGDIWYAQVSTAIDAAPAFSWSAG